MEFRVKTKRCLSLFFVLLLPNTSYSSAQNSSVIKDDTVLSPWRLFNKNKEQGLHLLTLHTLTTAPQYVQLENSKFSKSSYFDVLVQIYNYFGEYEKAATMEESFLHEINFSQYQNDILITIGLSYIVKNLIS